MKTSLLVLSIFSLLHATAQVSDSIVSRIGPLYYNIYGKGTPVLLFSGGPGLPAFMLEPMAIELSRNYQVVLPEQRGTGRSIPYSYDSTTINLLQATEDINALKERLGLNKLIIVGHSYGAALALYYAVKYPGNVEKLVLIGPGALEPGTSFAADNRISRSSVPEREAMKRFEDSIRTGKASSRLMENYTKLYLRTMIYDAYKADSLYYVLGKGGALNTKMNQLMTKDINRSFHLREEVGKVQVPTLVICGRQDPSSIFSTFEISERNKLFQIQWINKAGHYPFAEQPEVFYNILLPFLRR